MENPPTTVSWSETRARSDRLLLFCPVETKARELDAKTLLGCIAAQRGHRVIIGDMVELRRLVPFMPRGVYLSKSIPEKMEKYFRRYKELGYGVVAWCEEGLVFLNREIYKRKMVSQGALRYVDLFFTWGENQALAVAGKVPEARDKLRNVGNARIDLLRPPYREIYREEAEKLRANFGDYILFNTNFAAVNNVISREHAFLDSKKRGKIVTAEDERHYWRFFDHRQSIFEHMKELVGQISRKYPQQRIVVRPHPSENHDTWRYVVENLDNVEVIYDGPVLPWLLGARAVVHNGCTTAIEAYMLGIPSIAYQPVIEEGLEFELPNKVSVTARNPEAVVEALDFVTSESSEYDAWRRGVARHLDHYIADVEGGYASERIVDDLEQYYAANSLSPEPRLYPLVRLGKDRTKSALRAMKKKLSGSAADDERPGDKHRRQKFPGIAVQEIADVISRLQQESGCFSDVTVSPVRGTQRCFLIRSA